MGCKIKKRLKRLMEKATGFIIFGVKRFYD